ncbi:DNA adenine methylase [Variovorax sp. J22G73]|uniref:DNA adenine methylase n=1 Tax=unclassified Variovorax TaxID=663243 RepID=UPI00257905C5|nr:MULTISPECIES: DNA adenine methylase [unclassified Variovorax]MDM0003925.1 DNA adenine methylase [Variovorax sp. J22R203]MDM0096409.1 DNA adenine methylase [Variovorax sp. J22G73]
MIEVTRPALRYHGGKWKLAPWLQQFFPPHRVYVEAFGGGASVLLRKPRVYGEIYNDLDGEVVNVFRMLRDRGPELQELLALTPFARDEFEGAYEGAEDALEQARRSIARSFMGFGSAAATGERSGFRANSNRSGTTPAHDWANLSDAVPALIERLRGVVIENRDAMAVATHHDSATTLHYFDPPYVHSTRSGKVRGTATAGRASGKAYRHEMDDDAHRAFALVARSLEGMVVLSGYPCALYEQLFHDWERFERPSFADGARMRTEVVWLNPACSIALHRARGGLFADGAQ